MGVGFGKSRREMAGQAAIGAMLAETPGLSSVLKVLQNRLRREAVMAGW
jgi:hypothetical protein